MLSILLTSILLFQQVLIPTIINEQLVINEVIGPEQITEMPQSLGIKITAKSALLIDAESGQILFQKNSRQILPIASLTKLMAALVFLETEPNWQEKLEILSSDNIEIPDSIKNDNSKLKPVQIAFQVGELVKVEDLFAVGLIRSANNAIKALVRSAGGCCGNSFIDKMNNRTKELKMSNTIFVEPTGLNSNNKSTAEDLSKFIQEINRQSKIQQILLKQNYSFQTLGPGGKQKFYQVKNTDKLLNSFLKIKVAKTGYIDEAGYCFAGIVEYGGRQFIIVLLDSQSEQDRYQEIKGLAWWASNQLITNN